MYDNNYKSVIIADKPALLRMTNILFLALLAGQIIFGLLVLFVVNNGKMQFSIPPATDMFLIIVPVIALTSVAAGIFIFKLLLKKIAETEDMLAKLQLYLSATVIRLALIEGPSLLAIVCSMLTNNLFYIAISFLLIVYMISLRPTSYRIDNDINLNLTAQ